MRGTYSKGMWAAMADVVRAEGVLALYRGLLPSLFGIVPYVGIDFAVYDVRARQETRQASRSLARP
eukprot:1098076-Prymnesium_polylepis.1